MKLADLKFDNPNNACISLRVLAELIRRGEVVIVENKAIHSPGNAFITLDMKEASHAKK